MSNENGKHTQGEWRVGDPNKNILEQKHQVMCGKKVLATGNQNFIKQAEIDIALMASAPDLAQLNKEMLAMLKFIDHEISNCDSESSMCNVELPLAALIRKAEERGK